MNAETLQRLQQALQLLYNASRLAPMAANDHELCGQAARDALSIVETLQKEEAHDGAKPA